MGETVSGHVDIHAHVLPGIDDGPETIEASVAMARAAAAAGTVVLAATPHLHANFPNVDVEQIATGVEQVQAAIDAERIALRLVPAAEASLVWALEASDEHLRLATYGQRGTDLLIETPNDVSMIEQLIYQVRLRGVRVTLAHPERSETFQRAPERLARLHEQGILLQVNASGLLRAHSPGRKLIEHLVRNELADVMASDGHRATEWRPVSALADGAAALTALVGPARAQWMVCDAPGAIVAGQPLPPAPGIERPRRGLFARRR